MMQAKATKVVCQRSALANEAFQSGTTPGAFPETRMGNFGEQMQMASSTSDEQAVVEDQSVLKDDPKP